MIEFTGQLEVDESPDQVFELIADMAMLDQWNPSVRNSRQTART